MAFRLANEASHKELAQSFTTALATEREPLETVRSWLRQAVLQEAA